MFLLSSVELCKLINFSGRVSRDESLFVNPAHCRRQAPQDVDFVPLFFDELTNITEAQRIACEGNQQCL